MNFADFVSAFDCESIPGSCLNLQSLNNNMGADVCTHTHDVRDARVHAIKNESPVAGAAGGSAVRVPRVEVVYDYKHVGNDAAGKCGTVYIRVNGGRNNRTYVSTKVRVLPREWSDEYGVIGRADAFALNEKIKAQVVATRQRVADEVDAVVASGTKCGKIDLRAKDTKLVSGDATFIDFMRDAIDADAVCEDTKRQNRAQLAKLEEWGKMNRFEDVTPQRVEEFFAWCREKKIKKLVGGEEQMVEVSETTVANAWKAVRKFVKRAQKAGHIGPRAIMGVTSPQVQESDRVALSDEEVNAWLNVELTLPHLCDARDRYIVQMATGVDYSTLFDVDFSQREMIDGKMTLRGTRVKGRNSRLIPKKKKFFLVILPMAWEILERWEWKIPPISNQKYNEYLLTIEGILQLKKHVTSHVARHTYACMCLRHGIRLEAVQHTLGHNRIQTTQIYAKMVNRDVLDAFDDFKNVNGIAAQK